ncbi:MAG: hypothetical protein IPN96_12735 [Anaerolineales bacterium]|nr:hypothetical protein [Anaerolineales bacterium]
MNGVQTQSGKNNIHEPLTVDRDNLGAIFERDILKRRLLAEKILSRLREDDCPRALGIYGGWGTGKTSLINLLTQLNEQLPERGHRKLCLVSVDAWEYEVGEGLLIPVVVELKKMMGTDVPSKELSMVVKRVLLASTMIVADVLLKKYANLDVEKLDLSVQQVQDVVGDVTSHDISINYASILRKWEQQSIEVESTKKAFENLIEHACQRKECANIAICIDNLDRCSPDNVVRLLESVKVFFNVPHCIWVFAVDSEVIASYVNHKYEGTRMDGSSYLDKIIPEQYHLSLSPAVDGRNIVSLLRYAAGSNFWTSTKKKSHRYQKY